MPAPARSAKGACPSACVQDRVPESAVQDGERAMKSTRLMSSGKNTREVAGIFFPVITERGYFGNIKKNVYVNAYKSGN